MRAWIFFAAILFIFPLTLDAQSGSTDSQTLQALLSEVHQPASELLQRHRRPHRERKF